jgi:hypothetical protein
MFDSDSDSAGSAAGADSKVNRFFLTGSSDFAPGKAHIALYTQSGDILDDTDYEGFGWMAGYEYPLSMGKDDSIMSQLSILLEYDDKPFYLGTTESASVSIRYRLPQMSLSIGMLDVSNTNIFNIGGSYQF